MIFFGYFPNLINVVVLSDFENCEEVIITVAVNVISFILSSEVNKYLFILY